MTPGVTVIIVTHQSAAVLPGCLEALPRALAGLEAEVTVVDNASTDTTVEIASRWSNPPLEVMRSPDNLGYAAAINRGIRAHPAATTIVVLNPDVRLDPGSVKRLVEATTSPRAGIAVPRLRGPDGTLSWSLRRTPTPGRIAAEAILGGRRAARLGLGEVITDERAYAHRGPVDWATGAALVISASCRAAVGPWDETFFLYSEETDYCQRAAAAGFRTVIEPSAGAVHIGGEAPTSEALWALLTWNRFDLQRRQGRWRGRLAWTAIVAGELVRSVAGPHARVHRAAARALMHPRAQPLPPGAGRPPATS